MSDIAVGLVHYPVKDKSGKCVATSITNFDIHDIARACRVYNISRYYMIHPSQEQLMFVSRVLDHWRTGVGSQLNTKRKAALQAVRVASSIEEAYMNWGVKGQVVATSAQPRNERPEVSFKALREQMKSEPTFLLFGTGYGLDDPVLESVDSILEPIKGVGAEDYRHLSVRSAVSICLDRLLGTW